MSAAPDPKLVEPVAWLHPTAGWANKDWDVIARHCFMGGPAPVPLVRRSTLEAAEARIAALEAENGALREDIAYFEEEARRFASHYTPHSDGWNTFIIFADKIDARAALRQAEEKQL